MIAWPESRVHDPTIFGPELISKMAPWTWSSRFAVIRSICSCEFDQLANKGVGPCRDPSHGMSMDELIRLLSAGSPTAIVICAAVLILTIVVSVIYAVAFAQG
jgi:hypothetical protein